MGQAVGLPLDGGSCASRAEWRGRLRFAAGGLEGLKQQEAPISTAAAPRRGYLP